MINMRRTFESRLLELDNTLLEMGKTAEAMLSVALDALAKRDVALAREAIDMDNTVDALNYEVETMCIELIATQQPAARDLRRIFAALSISKDVERVGDYAVDIAKVAIRLSDRPLFKPLVDIPRMQELVKKMLREGLEGFVTRDLDQIHKMVRDDDQVDHLYKYLHDELSEFMKKDPGLVDQCVQLLFIARFLERIADHITNIGEKVYYVETGILKELHDDDGED